MAYMGYRCPGSSSIIYRSGMPDTDVHKNNHAEPLGDHGVMGTWVYGRDMLNARSD